MSIKAMRSFEPPLVLVCSLGAVVCSALASEVGQHEPETHVTDALKQQRSGPYDREFQIWLIDEIGKLNPNEAWLAITIALDNPHENVVLAALVGASLRPAEESLDRERYPVEKLRSLSTAGAPEVRQYARRALNRTYAKSAEAESWIVPMLRAEEDPSAAVDLIVLLNRNGIETNAGESALIEIAESRFDRVGHRAISVLAAQTSPPEAALPAVMSYLLSDAYAADPVLTQSLPRFGETAAQYVAVLEQLRSKLTVELSKPPTERTVTVYNDAFYLDQLDQAINTLAKMH